MSFVFGGCCRCFFPRAFAHGKFTSGAWSEFQTCQSTDSRVHIQANQLTRRSAREGISRFLMQRWTREQDAQHHRSATPRARIISVRAPAHGNYPMTPMRARAHANANMTRVAFSRPIVSSRSSTAELSPFFSGCSNRVHQGNFEFSHPPHPGVTGASSRAHFAHDKFTSGAWSEFQTRQSTDSRVHIQANQLTRRSAREGISRFRVIHMDDDGGHLDR